MADRYVLIARNRVTKELEPVHPGHVDRAEAERVAAVLMAQHGIRVDIRDADEWEREQDEKNADLFCPVCGMMKEDCDCRCTKCGVALHGVEYEDSGDDGEMRSYCEQHWRELPGNDADGGVSVCPNCHLPADEDEDGLHYCPRCDLQLDHLTEGCDECAPAAGEDERELIRRSAHDPELCDQLAREKRIDAPGISLRQLDEDRLAALDLLYAAQSGVDEEQERMFAAIHNYLYDLWEEKA